MTGPPWGISFSRLQALKGPQAIIFETPQYGDYEPTFGLEVSETLFGCQFRARYFFSRDDGRLYRIRYWADKKMTDEETVRQAFELMKKYIKSRTKWFFFNSCKKKRSYRIGNSDISNKEYFIIWEYQVTDAILLATISEKPGVEGGAAEISLTLYDSYNKRNVAAIKQSTKAVCFRPVGW